MTPKHSRDKRGNVFRFTLTLPSCGTWMHFLPCVLQKSVRNKIDPAECSNPGGSEWKEQHRKTKLGVTHTGNNCPTSAKTSGGLMLSISALSSGVAQMCEERSLNTQRQTSGHDVTILISRYHRQVLPEETKANSEHNRDLDPLCDDLMFWDSLRHSVNTIG